MAYMYSSVFEKPQCLIESSTDGKLKVVDDVLMQISQIEKQLNVVAITGLCRTGKSYLLNRLADSKVGFPLGSKIESKTKGIWAWCRPHPCNRDQVLLLLDTEGLGDVTKGDRNHDNWIFTLATLLSSTLVYNVMGLFDQDAFDKLSFVTEMSKHVTTSPNKEEVDNLDLYFPLFILTLRDFVLDLKSDGTVMTSHDYLETCLELRSGTNESDFKYNTPRQCIRKFFKTRKCFTFVSPGLQQILKEIETIDANDLNQGFVGDLRKFKDFVLRQCKPKSLGNGQAVTGRMFASLTKTYVKEIQDGKIPCIESALELMAQSENSKAVNTCVELYVEKMNSMVLFPVLDENGLSSAHDVCTNEAIALFLKNAVYDRDKIYQKQANVEMNVEYENFKTRNERESEVRCKAALAQLNKTIEANINDHVYARAGGYGHYQKDIMDIADKYNRKSHLGCMKEVTLLKYKTDKWSVAQTILQADQRVSETERKAEIERQRTIGAERLRKEAEIIANKQQKKQEDEIRQLRENMDQLAPKRKQETANEVEHNEYVIKKRREEHARLVKEGVLDEADKLKKGIEGLRDSQCMLM